MGAPRTFGKILIVVAALVGASGFLLDPPWAVAAVVADLSLLATVGLLGWRHRRRQRDDVLLPARLRPPAAPPGRVVVPPPPEWEPPPPEKRGQLTMPSVPPDPGPPILPPTPETAPPPIPAGGWPAGPLPRASRSDTPFPSTSSIHQVVRENKSRPAPPPAPAPVDGQLDELVRILRRTEQKGQSGQLWWSLASLAASIPIGVVINLLTG